MKWTQGFGTELPKGALAWVEHPTHGVVWAEKDFYTNMDPGEPEVHVWVWCAYGFGDVFKLEEVTRYWLITKPEPP